MKVKIIGLDGNDAGQIDLPTVFDTPYRPEVIQKVYVNLLSHSYQRQGRYPAAGEMVSAESRNTGLGIARLARARGEGFPRAGQAAGVAGVRHGRAAHPPEAWKVIYKKINHKERQLGLCSAIAATAQKELVKRRGHKIDDGINLPIVVSNEIESITKTRELKKVLLHLGLGDDIARASIVRKPRSGTARRRGRATRSGTSALIIVGAQSNLVKLSRSLPGVDIKHAKDISVTDLAPGSKPIRLVVFSQNSIEEMKRLQAPMHKVLEVIRK
ncbi:MAG: 50S ribosomal protein L4 [Thermoproteota archaeon]|jgi:large subunit ribosomal protein L4e|nr:50S ribosomal protein L4 [Thermoproteota archaeon]